MDNTNNTTPPTPHISLQDAAALLRSYGWTPGQVTAITDATEADWLQSRERAYRLADYNDARAARMAHTTTTITGGTGSSTRMPSAPKAKRPKKAAAGTGTAVMFEVVSIVIASIACLG